MKFICAAQNYGVNALNIFGITQDPETLNYMFVLDQMKIGSLRFNLKVKKCNPNDKYLNLLDTSKLLVILHDCDLVHRDLHSGNLLSTSYSGTTYISDLGLSEPVDKPMNSGEIYGVIPYIAPEVLRGKPYTKASDIYSIGIIMWELTSGVPAFNDRSHDFELSLDICKGLRPKIIEGIMPEYVELMNKCWDPDPNKRPDAKELMVRFYRWFNTYPTINRIPIPGKKIKI